MQVIRARAPLRISFSGGGTDVPPYPELLGGVVLSSTIQYYAYCSLAQRGDHKVRVFRESVGDVSQSDSFDQLDGENDLSLVKAVARNFSWNGGLDVYLRYDAPPGAGLGASSALCTALIGAFRELNGTSMTNYDIAKAAVRIERYEVAVPGGLQDQYASTFGGFNFIEFKKDATIVNPLRIRSEIIHELEYNGLLCFTGSTRQSGGILKRQISAYQQKNSRVFAALEQMKRLTYDMKDRILAGDLLGFGGLLTKEWSLKKELDGAISNEEIDGMLNDSLKFGAIGGKLLGAGGGGFLFLYCDGGKRNRVEQELEATGHRTYPVRFDPDGLQTWRTPNT